MKGRMIVDFETDRIVAKMDISGKSAGDFARAELDGVKVTRLHVMNMDEPQGERPRRCRRRFM